MKKYIVGAMVGATLMFSAQSFAAVGDKVEAIFAEFSFIVNGKSVTPSETPIVINGNSYLPVRSIANLLNYNVTYLTDTRTIQFNGASVTGGTYGAVPVVPVTPSPVVTTSVPTQPSSEPPLSQPTSNELPYKIIENYININGIQSVGLVINGKTYVSMDAGLLKYSFKNYDWNGNGMVIRDSNNFTIIIDPEDGSTKKLDFSKVLNKDAFFYGAKPFVNEEILKRAMEKR